MAEPVDVEEVVVTGKRRKPSFAARLKRTARLAVKDPDALVQGAIDLPGSVVRGIRDYAASHTPGEVVADAGRFGKQIVQDVAEHPVQSVLGALPFVGSAMSAYDTAKAREAAADARAQGNTALADKYEQLAAAGGAMLLAGMLPGGRLAAKAGSKLAEDAALNEARKLVERYGLGAPRLRVDNPGGEWLASKRRAAEARAASNALFNSGFAPGAPSGPITGYYDRPMLVDPNALRDIPGAMNESPRPGDVKYDALVQAILESGYKPNTSILLGVNYKGEPFIIEGNNRAAVARDLGLPAIPAEIRYYAGGEQMPGPLAADQLQKYLYQPASSPATPPTAAVPEQLGAKYGLPEYTVDLTLEQIAENKARYPTRAYHGTPLNRGPEGAFTQFRDMNAEGANTRNEWYKLDRRLGAHFAKDPEISNTFTTTRGAFPETVPGSHVLPVQLPAEHEFFEVSQPLNPASDPSSPYYKPELEKANYPLRMKIMPDERAIERLIVSEAYRRDPKLLARYIMDEMGINEQEALQEAKSLLSGGEDSNGLLFEDYVDSISVPEHPDEVASMVEAAREALREKGYKGVKYINTAPDETANAKDFTSYIVFDPRDVKSTFNRGTYDPNDPHLNKAKGGLIRKYRV